MRRAIAIVLSAILVTTPIKVVLAQAGQQESQVAATDSTRMATDQTPTRIGVPVVEPNSHAALLLTVGVRADTLASDALPLSPPYRGVSTAGKVALIAVGLAVAVFMIVIVGCAASESCRS